MTMSAGASAAPSWPDGKGQAGGQALEARSEPPRANRRLSGGRTTLASTATLSNKR